MAGFTNRGKYLMAKEFFWNEGAPTAFYVALCTAVETPTTDTNTMAELDECDAGNGYDSGGKAVPRSILGFDEMVEDDDVLDIAYAQIVDLVWTADGGDLPDGAGARWAVLTTDEVLVEDRQVVAFFDLTSPRTVSDGQTLSLIDCELRLTE